MAFEKVMMIMVAFAVMLVSTQAQDPTSTSCIQALMPCAQFINATDPPAATCCGPLKEAFKTQLPCLCSIFENPELASASNINMTQAMELPIKCGLKTSDPNICKKGQETAPSKAPVAGGEPTTSSESSPGPTDLAESSAANSVTWAGPISSLMLLLTGLMFY